MSADYGKENLHRGVKLLADLGQVSSMEEGYRVLTGYRLAIYPGPEIRESVTLQAALLTAVNIGRRSLLGGVMVIGCPEAALMSPLSPASTLREAVLSYGGMLSDVADPESPALVLGTPGFSPSNEAPILRATFQGWTAAVAPLGDGLRLAESKEFAPSGVLCGALAVSEVFQHLLGQNAAAARRPLGLSLWQPAERDCWQHEIGPSLKELLLPQKLWIIGLGHLGQAYLWTLMSLPYAAPGRLELVLQDYDRLSEANWSTGVLTPRDALGQKKTRHLARVCEARGFSTTIVERAFDDRFGLTETDPLLALCGVHDARSRRVLGCPGFHEIIEAGLGHGAGEYLQFQIHTFPGSKTPDQVWDGDESSSNEGDLLAQPAYQALAPMLGCGLYELAGSAVGAPFVGTTVATLVIAEAIRAVMDGPRCEVVSISLRDPMRRTVLQRAPLATPRNLGHLLPEA